MIKHDFSIMTRDFTKYILISKWKKFRRFLFSFRAISRIFADFVIREISPFRWIPNRDRLKTAFLDESVVF